jgi:hypothetical protein
MVFRFLGTRNLHRTGIVRPLSAARQVLYEMCTGVIPFRGDTSALIFNSILERAPVASVRLNPDVPHKLEEIIEERASTGPLFNNGSLGYEPRLTV